MNRGSLFTINMFLFNSPSHDDGATRKLTSVNVVANSSLILVALPLSHVQVTRPISNNIDVKCTIVYYFKRVDALFQLIGWRDSIVRLYDSIAKSKIVVL